jgi:Protein of unknown function (DUF2795)
MKLDVKDEASRSLRRLTKWLAAWEYPQPTAPEPAPGVTEYTLQQLVDELRYPMTKASVVSAALSAGLDEDEVTALAQIEGQSFNGPADLWEAIASGSRTLRDTSDR